MARVLVVNDDKDFVDTVKTCLESIGHAVAATFTAEGAIAAAHAFHPDVAIVDWHIGDARGDTVVKAFRAGPLLQSLPVILLSSAADQEEVVQLASVAGVDRILRKPCAIDALAREIERLI